MPDPWTAITAGRTTMARITLTYKCPGCGTPVYGLAGAQPGTNTPLDTETHQYWHRPCLERREAIRGGALDEAND